MSCDYYYNLCKDNIGSEVEIRDHHGKVYVGTIERVDSRNVYLRPIGPSPSGPDHCSYFFAAAALTVVALASIAAFRFRRRRFRRGPVF
ncbi:hypothetical protein [Evansella halocellulosilytica]|uniref:hypothetical protein n=1 Tax=Evansella halocellulosilytica TaxID=2011013 RepID=UPI000BB6AF88|nr:hypothetical protein [Evansella halocellulosilytica]